MEFLKKNFSDLQLDLYFFTVSLRLFRDKEVRISWIRAGSAGMSINLIFPKKKGGKNQKNRAAKTQWKLEVY
jgi:hypothetical protein